MEPFPPRGGPVQDPVLTLNPNAERMFFHAKEAVYTRRELGVEGPRPPTGPCYTVMQSIHLLYGLYIYYTPDLLTQLTGMLTQLTGMLTQLTGMLTQLTGRGGWIPGVPLELVGHVVDQIVSNHGQVRAV